MIPIRPLILEDVPRLREINPSFTSTAALQVEKVEEGLGVAWRLREATLAQPFDKGHGYDMNERDLAEVRETLAGGRSLQRVAEDAGRLVAFIDVRRWDWNHTAWVWCIGVDRAYHGRGLGRRLMEEAIAWARAQGYRALCLETQSNNISACRFYHHLGFHLTGIRDDFYTNEDFARGEVALFYSLPLHPLSQP